MIRLIISSLLVGAVFCAPIIAPCQQDVPTMAPPCQQDVPATIPPCQQDVPATIPPCQQDVPATIPPCQQDVPATIPPCQQDVPATIPPCQQDVPTTTAPCMEDAPQPTPCINDLEKTLPCTPIQRDDIFPSKVDWKPYDQVRLESPCEEIQADPVTTLAPVAPCEEIQADPVTTLAPAVPCRPVVADVPCRPVVPCEEIQADPVTTLAPAVPCRPIVSDAPAVPCRPVVPCRLVASDAPAVPCRLVASDASVATDAPVVSETSVISITEAPRQPLDCRDSEMRYKDSCYYIERKEQKTLQDAEKDCIERGSTLFVADSEDEFNNVMLKAPMNTFTWVGLYKKGESELPSWHTESSMDYTDLPWLINFDKKNINLNNGWSTISQCAALWNPSTNLGRYVYYYPCTYKYYYVCERKANTALPKKFF